MEKIHFENNLLKDVSFMNITKVFIMHIIGFLRKSSKSYPRFGISFRIFETLSSLRTIMS